MKVVCMTVVKRGEKLPGTVAAFILEFHQALEHWCFLDPGPGLDLTVYHEVLSETPTGLLYAKRVGWRGRKADIVFGFGTDFLAASPADQKAQYISFVQAAVERLKRTAKSDKERKWWEFLEVAVAQLQASCPPAE